MPKPKWLSETAGDRARKMGQRREKRTVRKAGMRLTPRSGAGRIKGDGQSAQAVMEVKTTAGEGFRITRAILDKLVRQAGSKVPILSIEFVGGKNPQTWVMYPSFKIEGL